MLRRSFATATVGLVAVVTSIVIGLAGPAPAGAAPQPFTLEMATGGGQLLLRGAEEARELATPTTIAGTLDTGEGGTGAVTGVTFSTPTIQFEQPVLGGSVTADITAVFSEVTPGSGTGSVDPRGNVVVRSNLRVDLHIDVLNGSVVGDCVASPIALELRSTAPYDPATQQVTLSDADFAIASVPVTPSCNQTVANGVNDSLSGAGHSLSLAMAGALELPPAPRTASATTLTVDPGSSGFGDEVTLAAEVVSNDPSTSAVPSGEVEFLDGRTVLDAVTLTDGRAELATTALRVGSRSLTARYVGDATFGGSTSAVVTHRVAATPDVEVDMPSLLTIGGDPVPVTATVTNPAAGSAVEDVRLDFALGGTFLPVGSVVLEAQDGAGAWVPVPLSPIPGTNDVAGTVGPVAGQPLAAGASLPFAMRLAILSDTGAVPGTVIATVTAVQVEPGTGTEVGPVASGAASAEVVPAERAAVNMTLATFGAPAISPPNVRQGNTVYVNNVRVASTVPGAVATGFVSAAVDGRPVLVSWVVQSDQLGPAPQAPLSSGSRRLVIALPEWVAPGPHTLTMRYGGDTAHLPGEVSSTFTVYPPNGTLYECSAVALATLNRFNAQVTALGDVPAYAPAGEPIDISRLDVTMRLDRGLPTVNVLNQLFGAVRSVAIDPTDGEGSADSAAVSASVMRNAAETELDSIVTFTGEAAQVTPAGDPGELVPVTLGRIAISGGNAQSAVEMECLPVGDPVEIDTVTLTGTSLEVAAPTPTRADDLVGLTATVAPAAVAGTVGFYADGELIGQATPANGVAATIVELPVGTHQLTARFRTGSAATSTTSDPVEVEVLPAVECATFAEAGSGAVVRLAYMELLRRCPDAAGFAFWKGRLDAGTSAQRFAATIADSDEARNQIVIDAYRTVLDRDPSPTDRDFWRERLERRGGRYQLLLAELAASPEFFRASGSTRAGVVARIYDRILQRTASEPDIDYWAGELLRGTSRAAVVLKFANLTEPLGRLVDASYDEILSVAPSAGERSAAIAALRATGDRTALYTRLVGDPRFALRAATFPNPED